MWLTIIPFFGILICLPGVRKPLANAWRKTLAGFAASEGMVFLLVIVLITVGFSCSREDKTEGGETAEAEAPATREEKQERRLLSQIQDYMGKLNEADRPQVAHVLRVGLEYKISEEYTDALETFKQALDLNLYDEERLAFFILMGNCEAHLKEYTSAINYYFQAERLGHETENDTALAVTYSNLALAFQLEKDSHGALNNYFNLLKVYQEMGNLQGQRNTLAAIGLIYQIKGEVDSASVYHKRSLELDVPGVAPPILAQAAQLNNLALTYRSKGKLDSALVLSEQALLLFQRAGDYGNAASVLTNMGMIYQEMGDVKRALEYHRQALEIDSTIGHLMGQAGDLTNIGSVLEQEGSLAEAKESYQRALSLFEKMEAKTEIEFVRQNIQRVEEKLKE
ncbi:MAG: tetratricopeptide repeat protein [Candidatus Zixiibacteriota bacterium]